MPYSKAHYFLIATLLVTVLAFWPSYFGRFGNASIIDHSHGLTGTLWLLLIALQNYLAHSGSLRLHRRLGRFIFFLIPLLIGSFWAVTWVGASKSAGGHPFYEAFGRALLTSDVLLALLTPVIVYLALRFRHQTALHSALMISTVIGLLPPILSRLFTNNMPGLQITGPETMVRFGTSLTLAIAVSVLIALLLFVCYRRSGWPWILAAGITGLTYVSYATVGQTQWWEGVVTQIAQLPIAAFIAFGVVSGLIACIAGWRSGSSQPIR